MPVVDWSPDLLGPGQKIPRSVVHIPKDQERLLRRDDAWSRIGIPNVPVEVLESVKSFYLQNHKPLSQNQSPEKDAEPADDSDDEGSAISWEQSPTQHRVGPPPVKASESLASTRNSTPSPGLTRNQLVMADELEPRLVQVQEPEPEPRQKPHARRNLPLDPPMSSLASADEILEVEKPKAIDAPLDTVIKEAGGIPLDPTPPSAQIIPSTYIDHSQQGSSKPPQAIRQRLMKDPSKAWGIPKSPKVHSPAATAPTSAISLTKLSSKPGSSGETRTTKSTTSVPDVSSLPPVARVVNKSRGFQETSHQAHSSSSERIPPNGPPSQVPYTAFKLAYPDFDAPKNDFIRALLSLKHIQKNKSIPRGCYDDFVRVFCGDFMGYITRDPDDGEETLSAAKFYNWHFEGRLYTKGLITPENLQDAINQYPSEVAAIITERPKRTGSKKAVNTKPSKALPGQAAQPPTPKPDKGVPKTPLIVSSVTLPKEKPDHSHLELASDPIDAPAPAANLITKEPNKPLAYGVPPIPKRISPKPTVSARASSVPKSNSPHPHRPRSPEFIPPSPSINAEGEAPTRPRQEEPRRLSTSRQASPMLDSGREEPRRRSIAHLASPALCSRREEPSRLSTTHQTPAAPGFKVPPLPAAAAPTAAPHPTQTLTSDETRRPEVAPVAAYGKRHSLRAEPLVDTSVPLSQQSTAESIVEPKRKKRRTKKDVGDVAFAKYLEKRFSSSAPGPGTSP